MRTRCSSRSSAVDRPARQSPRTGLECAYGGAGGSRTRVRNVKQTLHTAITNDYCSTITAFTPASCRERQPVPGEFDAQLFPHAGDHWQPKLDALGFGDALPAEVEAAEPHAPPHLNSARSIARRRTSPASTSPSSLFQDRKS